jgi:hypothetical protein
MLADDAAVEGVVLGEHVLGKAGKMGTGRCEEIVERLFTTEALRCRGQKKWAFSSVSQCLSGGDGNFSHLRTPVARIEAGPSWPCLDELCPLGS